jgi:hypothetical protein
MLHETSGDLWSVGPVNIELESDGARRLARAIANHILFDAHNMARWCGYIGEKWMEHSLRVYNRAVLAVRIWNNIDVWRRATYAEDVISFAGYDIDHFWSRLDKMVDQASTNIDKARVVIKRGYPKKQACHSEQ